MDTRIQADLRDSYQLAYDAIAPVAGGYLNRKWKITCGGEAYLVKQFDNRRFYSAKLMRIEAALQRQMFVSKNGAPCPSILRCGERAIRLLDGETAYMVMEFLPGWIETPETITLSQLQSLGDACGRIQREFAKLPQHTAEGYPIDGARLLESLWVNFRTRAHECPPGAYGDAVFALEPILKALSAEFFEKLPKEIAHEDFSPDNILFLEDRVSAVIDFDRNIYSFLWHDLGRAILSLALEGDHLNLDNIRAILTGYQRHFPITMRDVPDVLRLTWCIESPWWIQPKFFEAPHAKVARFRDEMLWLTRHWFELDDML